MDGTIFSPLPVFLFSVSIALLVVLTKVTQGRMSLLTYGLGKDTVYQGTGNTTAGASTQPVTLHPQPGSRER